MVSFDSSRPGTSAGVWDADPHWQQLPRIDVAALRELVVISAHPDDETLGCGGFIALAEEAGIPIRVIVVTDGAASHPGSPTISASELRARRAAELREAIRRLAPSARVIGWDVSDGHSEERRDQIAAWLRDEFADIGSGSAIVTVWAGDGHRDHRVVGEAVRRAAPAAAAVWSYPVWMWQWADPDRSALPWHRAAVVELTPEALRRKQSALHAFVSQTEPLSPAPGDERVLEPWMLAHFDRGRELLFAGRDPVIR